MSDLAFFFSALVYVIELARKECRAEVVDVHLGNEVRRNVLRTDRFTLVEVGAVAKAFGIGGLNHPHRTTYSLWLALRQQAEM